MTSAAKANRNAEIVDRLEAEIERLRATLADLRTRSVEEGIHHFVKRIDAALGPATTRDRKDG